MLGPPWSLALNYVGLINVMMLCESLYSGWVAVPTMGSYIRSKCMEHIYTYIVRYKPCVMLRLVPIMLLKLPIMLWSNAPKFPLLCSNYAPLCSTIIQHFLFSYHTYIIIT